MRTAGLHGDFLEFSDPFCIGPLSDSDPQTLLRERAAFLADAFNLEPADALGRQQQGYGTLLKLDKYQRIVLWFEHDSYDQLILAYLLVKNARNVTVITATQYTGEEFFQGGLN